jgi:hypothetical protein
MSLILSALLLLAGALGCLVVAQWLDQREQRKQMTRLDAMRKYVGVAPKRPVS